jgi:hypothetical protein
VIQDYADALIKMLRTDMNNYTDDLATGSCRSFEDYKHLCGVIQGLAIAERYVLDLAQKVEKFDE